MSGITVLIPTYNNSEMLAKTLDSLGTTDYSAHDVEVVVIDNNSSDDTRTIVKRHAQRITVISYLFEAKQGKNCAINRALSDITLRDIVFFTDDDVTFQPDFFECAGRSVEKWPEHSVFGGRVFLIWPEGEVPGWAQELAVQGKAFSKLDLGDDPKVLASGQNPVGTCLWIRREVFGSGRRFNEGFGPRPKDRVMGSETSFLISLRKAGYSIFYDPSVQIGHRVPHKLLERRRILKRALSSGRGGARLRALSTEKIAAGPVLLWILMRLLAMAKWIGLFVFYLIAFPRHRGITKQWTPVQGIGWNYEMLHMLFFNDKPYDEGRA